MGHLERLLSSDFLRTGQRSLDTQTVVEGHIAKDVVNTFLASTISIIKTSSRRPWFSLSWSSRDVTLRQLPGLLLLLFIPSICCHLDNSVTRSLRRSISIICSFKLGQLGEPPG